MSRNKVILIVALLGLVALFFGLDLGRFLSLAYLKQSQAEFAVLYAENPLAVMAGFLAIYVVVTALSLPGAVIMTLAGGALFGLLLGTVLVSFASSIGATLAFLASRYVLRDSVQARFGNRLADINKGIEKDGAFYLVTLRLVPLVPFFVINLVMGLTRMKAGVFYLASQVGMLAGTVVYVNAGTQLARIDSLAGIVSPGLLGSFVLLGVFPLVAKKIVEWVKGRKVYARWAAVKPKSFDRNMVVIGAGAAGLVTSYIAAVVKARVTLVEGHKMGGDCLNYGCVPSKALIKTATLVSQMKHSADYGVAHAEATLNFADVMDRIAKVVKAIEPHDSIERYTGLGVEVLTGHAKMLNPWTVEVALADGTTQTLTTRSIVIATGASPFVPPLPGLADVGYLTSDTLWGLRELPRQPGGAGRWPHRLRAGPELCTAGCAGHADRDGRPHHGARRRGGQRVGPPGVDARRGEGAHRAQGAALRAGACPRGRRSAQGDRGRGRWRGTPHPLRPAAVCRGPGGPAQGLWAGGAGHTRRPHHRDQRVSADGLPQHPGCG